MRTRAVTLGVLASLVVVGTAAGWTLTIRVPGRSHAGPLPPLTPAE